MLAKRSDIYYLGVLGLIGLIGVPPFNVLAWYFGRRDLRAPDFARRSAMYQERVRFTHRAGILGTVVMFFWLVPAVLMLSLKAIGLV